MPRRWSLFARAEPAAEVDVIPDSIGPRQAEILRRLSMPRMHNAPPPQGTGTTPYALVSEG